MVFKQGENIFRVANRHKNLFVLKTGLKAKVMLVRRKGRPTYLFSKNL